ncbi:hypothetical protein V6R21_19960 [Limibacter armeniacum]|uniref:hypothetical protein n=1 Tax=Limibacter armeniacum TaxID=466084 RepID=UPI002FE5827A
MTPEELKDLSPEEVAEYLKQQNETIAELQAENEEVKQSREVKAPVILVTGQKYKCPIPITVLSRDIMDESGKKLLDKGTWLMTTEMLAKKKDDKKVKDLKEAGKLLTEQDLKERPKLVASLVAAKIAFVTKL